MSNTLDRQLAELDEFPEEIVERGEEGYEYGLTREAEPKAFGLGYLGNLFTPYRQEVIEPEVTTRTRLDTLGMDSVPGEYLKTYKPAEYGEPEFGLEYMPIVRGSKAAFDYAVDLFDSGEVIDKTIDSIAAIPSAMSDAIADQVTSAMGMGMGYESLIDRDGTEIRYDPLMAPATMAPAGIAARVVSKETGDTVLGIFGGRQGNGYGDRVNAENEAVSDIVDALEKRDGKEYSITNANELIKKAEDGEVGILDESDADFPAMVTGAPAARYFREMIFRKSGVFIGEDGQKRYEIRTRDAGLGRKLQKALEEDLGGDEDVLVAGSGKVDNLFTYGDAYLDDVIALPELFDEYPQLRDFRVEYLDAEDIAEGVGGHMDIGDKTIRINPSRVPTGDEREDYKNFMSLMLHEVQHAVDHFEGRQNGANIQMFLPNNFKAQKMNNDISISFQGSQIINHMDASRKLPSPEELFSPDGLKGNVDDIYSTIDSIYIDLKTMQGLKDGTIDPNSRAGELINDPNHLEQILEDDYLVELLRRTKPYVDKYDQLSLDKFNASKKYLATSGEVDAREVESRYKNPERQRYDFGMLNKQITPENILEQEVEDFRIPGQYGVFPEKDIVQKDINLTDYEGNPISIQTDKAFSLMEPDTVKAVGLTEDDIKAWRRPKEEGGNATSEEFRKSLKGRDETLQAMAKKVEAGEADISEYRQMADERRPIRKVDKVPEPATPVEIVSALNAGQRAKGIVGVNKEIPDGDLITARLDINAYTNYDVWVPTLTHPELKTVYAPSVVMRDVSFIKPDDKAVTSARRVATGGEKAPFAVMQGRYVDMNADDAFKYAQETFDSDEWTQVGYDPVKRGFFYDRETGEAVVAADEVIQVGHLVLARNASKMAPEEFPFNRGGLMSR